MQEGEVLLPPEIACGDFPGEERGLTVPVMSLRNKERSLWVGGQQPFRVFERHRVCLADAGCYFMGYASKQTLNG